MTLIVRSCIFFKSFKIAMPIYDVGIFVTPQLVSRGFARDVSTRCSKDALQNDLEVIYEACKYGLI